MHPQRLVRTGAPAEVSVLALMALTLALGCLGSAAFPMAQDTPRGILVVEAGRGQSGWIEDLMIAEGLTPAGAPKADLAGIQRAVAGRKMPR